MNKTNIIKKDSVKVNVEYKYKKNEIKVNGFVRIDSYKDEDGEQWLTCFLLPESNVVINGKEVQEEQMLEHIDEILSMCIYGKNINDINDINGNIVDLINHPNISNESIKEHYSMLFD